MKKSQMYAIYYSNQERKYKKYMQQIESRNLTAQFNQFKAHYKGVYKNKVYYYFFKSLEG